MAFEDVDVVFNLLGESVAEGRWTEEKKRRIVDSRVVGTKNLVATIRLRITRNTASDEHIEHLCYSLLI